MVKPSLQRLLELCEVLRECELMQPGMFRLWARINAQREIAEIVFFEVLEVTCGNTGATARE